MEVRELRVGNWISSYVNMDARPAFIGEKEIRKIQVTAELIKFISDNFMTTYNPIPITPEILEKCGFVLSLIPSYYEGQSGEIYSILLGPAKTRFLFLTKMHMHSATWLVYVTENLTDANKSSQLISTVAYLHKLQNLYFSLTDKELVYEP